MSQFDFIVERAKGIIRTPKQEWEVIATEKKSTMDVFKSYFLPLSAIPVVACYIGYGIVGSDQGMFGKIATAKLGYSYAALSFITFILSTFLTALIISSLAGHFEAQKNFNRAYKLVVYSYTPMLLASIFYIIPVLSPLVVIAGIYYFYLLYYGIKPMTKVSDEKMKSFFFISLAATIVVYLLVSLIITPIIFH
ncbi:MAG TPA: Yip1 family protein [Prolixibacteraceae bacterium]|nr:Yip1 family protein [Prolixibacteraceae bacterium]HPS13671.1 Yip1 family protein [Prolixibacteraceae bacterium]